MAVLRLAAVVSVVTRYGRRNAAVVGVAVVLDIAAWGGDTRVVLGGESLWWVPPLAVLLLYPALIWRVERPVTVFALMWVFALSTAVLPLFQPFVGLLLALHAVASRTPLSKAVAALALSAVPFGAATYNFMSYTVSPWGAMLSGLLWGVLAGVAWGSGRWVRTTRERAIVESARAVRAERVRLARELHDSVAGAISVMILQATAGTACRDPDGGARFLATIAEVGEHAMDDMQRLVRVLRAAEDSPDDRDPGHPGVDDLPALVQAACAGGNLEVTLAVSGEPVPTGASTELAVHRIVQEGLTNVRKHGGQGASVEVRVLYRVREVEVIVRNTAGQRSARPVRSSGVGLRGLAERVDLLGGRLSAGYKGSEYELRATLPCLSPSRAEVLA